jgi:NAD(P)-dependent dehydrogenase (short-subunit alcohol dehydrogenase family)
VTDFTGRTVLITGAAGGIGAATARTIAAAGGGLVLHDLRREGALAALVDELGDRATALTADLSHPAAAEELWRDALASRGQIDVLINNAGIYEPAVMDGGFAEWEAAWQRMLAICLVTPAALCRAAIPTFAAQDGGGIIVNLASRAAWRGEDPDYWHYASAKAGVIAMTKTIARQYGRKGITAFAVAPGFVDTPFNDPSVAEHGIEMFIRDTALGEVAQPQDVANVIAFLASGAARHATGATIDVNSASYVR